MEEEHDSGEVVEGPVTDDEGIQSEDAVQPDLLDSFRYQLSLFTTNLLPGNNGHSLNLEDDSTLPPDYGNISIHSSQPNTLLECDFSGNILIDAKFPSPPSASPSSSPETSQDPQTSISEDDVVDTISGQSQENSGLSRIDSYVWSSASSSLPSTLRGEEDQTIIPPLEDYFSVCNGQFEENVQWYVITNLGEGAFGQCYFGEEITADNGRVRQFCVKKCQYKRDELLALEQAREHRVFQIVEFYGATLRGKEVCIFMEFMAGGNVKDLIERKKKSNKAVGGLHVWPIIAETDCLGYLEDVLTALKFLHGQGIVHNDVKGENVLLDQLCLVAKLADFGSAEAHTASNRAIDVWKTGCLLLEMINGERPPLAVVKPGLGRQNSCKPEDSIPPEAMEETKDVLSLCFGLKTTNGGDIPSAAEVLNRSKAFPVKELLFRLKKGEGN